MRIIAIGIDEVPVAEDPAATAGSVPTAPKQSAAVLEGSKSQPEADAAVEKQQLPEASARRLSDRPQASPATEQLQQIDSPAISPREGSVPPPHEEDGGEGRSRSTPSRKPPPPKRHSLEPGPSEPKLAAAAATVATASADSDSKDPSRAPKLVATEPALAATSAATTPSADPDSTDPEELEEVEAVEASMPATSVVPRHPPEPPRRQKSVTEVEEARPAPKSTRVSEKPKRRPWWEELFNEDYSRAFSRLSDHQIEHEVSFIEESLGVVPGAVVLDLGCGSGEHAVELASRGYGVVGYDLSVHQLALAQESAQSRGQKINFLQGDMREMAFEELFDGVYCWNTTFGYFEEDKNFSVLERIFRSLKPGGALLLDVMNRDFAAMDQPSSVWYEGDSCVCMDDMSVDFLASRLRVKRSLILDDGRTRECHYSIRLYSLHELGRLLHDAGFRVTEASGHPATPGVFFGQNSPRLIVLAQKP